MKLIIIILILAFLVLGCSTRRLIDESRLIAIDHTTLEFEDGWNLEIYKNQIFKIGQTYRIYLIQSSARYIYQYEEIQ